MPELPEVETILRGLQPKIINLKISRIEVLNTKSFSSDTSEIIGATIQSVWRRAKILGIDLSNNRSLLIHLKMSGQIIFINNLKRKNNNSKSERFSGGHPTKDMLAQMPNNSTRVIFDFTNGAKLFFNDQRKFGWIKIVPTDQLSQDLFIAKLGPEPLSRQFTPKILQHVLAGHPKMPIKVALLDQSTIAGIGNIYASEACFLAGLDPKTPVQNLTAKDYQRLHRGIIDSLKSSIKYGGSSKHTYVNESGEKGYFLEVANVYDRQNLPCRRCRTIIQKITLRGRSTYFCPHCQDNLR